MDGSIIGFIIWAVVGCFIIGMGIKAFFSKKTAGFWANIKTMPVDDVTGYNHAIGKLFILYGVIFILLGMPLFSGQNTPYILLSVFGVVIETIAIMAIYSLFIEKNIEKNRIILFVVVNGKCKKINTFFHIFILL